MDIPETTKENGCEPELEPREPKPTKPISSGDILDLNTWKGFFNLTGGSLLYCLSAVFVAYGIVKVMGPILSDSDSLLSALPCIFTLHIYELALLGVLILIVSKKVVDDAISVVILMSLFLVGTSIAQGAVADRDITISFFVGLFGITVAFGKFYAMRRFARIPFGALSVWGLGVLMVCNCLGPILMARSISVDPSQEFARRGLWMFLWVTILIAAGIVLIEAMRGKYQQAEQNDRAFLQSPVMAYVFALILLIASGVHQYSMAFTFALERVLGDFVPLITLATLLLLEILRRSGKRFGFTEIVISCVPLATMLLAINEKSVLASGQLGFGLMCYPPVTLASSGLAIAALALYHRWYPLLAVVFAYGLGVILTAGFSPQHPYDLNIHACVGTLVVALLVYGTIIRNQYICLAGIIILCFGLSLWDGFSKFATSYHLTEVGGLAGVCGLGSVAFYLLFGHRLHKAIRIVGTLCLAGFVFDYLPDYTHWRYLIVLLGTGLLVTGLWFRTRDILVISILWVPSFIRLYIVAKHIAYWRLVILGFLLLAAGTVASLLKRPTRNRICQEKPEKPGDTSP